MGNFTPDFSKYSSCLLGILFVFIGLQATAQNYLLQIDSPSSIAGEYSAFPSTSFGLQLGPCDDLSFSGELMLINDGIDTVGTVTDGCDPIIDDLTDKIALIDRGACNFTVKALNAQEQGAIAVIICNNNDDAPFPPGGTDPNVTVPTFMISRADCAAIRTEATAMSVTGNLVPNFPSVSYDPSRPVIWGNGSGEGQFEDGLGDWTTFNPFDTTGTEVWTYTESGGGEPGLFAGSGGFIDSPTRCNGAAIFNADFYITDGATNNAPSGPPYGDFDAELISPTIDLSNVTSGVALRFTQYVTLLNNTGSDPYETSFSYSTDNGETWSDPIEINGELANNTTVSNIQAFAIPGLEGNSEVKIKFTYSADFYIWIIDDVQIIEREANNMRVNDNFFAVPQNAITPMSQVEPINFLADIENIGSEEQTNVNLNVTVTQGEDNIVFTEDLDYGAIGSDSLAENVPFVGEFTPESMGTYMGSYTVTADSTDFDPSDNTQTFTFEVSDTTFAKELGQTGTVVPLFDDGATHSWAMGNHYHVVNGTDADGNQQYIRSIGFGIGNATEENAGRPVIIQVYEWEDLNEDAVVDPDERISLGFNFYEIQGDEPADSLIVIPFPEEGADPIPLQDDTDYIVMMEYSTGDEVNVSFATGEDIDYFATVFLNGLLGTPRYGALLGVADDLNTEPYSTVGFDGSAYSIVPRVRMHVGSDPTVSTNDLLLPENTFALSPNPADDVLRVDFDLEAKESVVRIFSVTGQLIERRELQNLQNETLEFNVNNYAAGTYFLQVETDEGRRTKKFVVAK